MTATVEDINYAVIRKHDPALTQLFFTSSMCSVYKFNIAAEQWDKTEVQGSLFMYSRVANDDYPYAALVLNRNNNQDFFLGITPTHISLERGRIPLSVKLEDKFLMVQVSPEEIYGLWLFDEIDREKLNGLMSWCLTNGSR